MSFSHSLGFSTVHIMAVSVAGSAAKPVGPGTQL